METAVTPRTTLWSPQRWSDDPSWKRDYNNVERLSPADIAELRREFDQLKETARQLPGRRREAGSV
jgi:D-proline reductase (dithiol) PrdB